MKKTIALILALVCVLSLAACAGKEDTAVSLYDENMPNKLLHSQVADFPLATDSLSYEERRQLCLDFFKLQLEFQWKPNIDVADYVSYYKGYTKGLYKDNLYEGIPYGGVGTGSIYRWLEYYDETTGIMDLETAFAENGGWGEGAYVDGMKKATDGNSYPRYRSLMALFNQCSSAPGWAWSRVINTARFGMTKDTNVYNGYIPVGCYSYGYEMDGQYYDMTVIDEFGVETENNPLGYDTDDVIRDMQEKGGATSVYDYYAQLKPGDCLVNEGHELMVVSVDVLRRSDGSIDYDGCMVMVMEQIDGWGKKDTFNGTPLFQQGSTLNGYMFETLMKKHYIPFTFVELLDPNDEQDKKHLDFYNSYADKLTAVENSYSAISFSEEMNGSGIEKGQVYSTLGKDSGSVTVAQLQETSVASNYSVGDVFVIVTDSNGNQLLKNIWRSECYHSREVSLMATRSTFDQDANGNLATLCTGLEELAGKGNTVQIILQIGTGEKLTVFNGTLD